MSALGRVRGWVLDVDGCLVRTSRAGGRGGVAIDGAAELTRALHAAGHRVIVCTNASEKTPHAYAEHLRSLGIEVTDEDFVTAGSATADHVHTHHPGARVLVVGDEGITEPLAALGAPLAAADEPLADVVAVGAAATYDAETLSAAALAVDAGAAFYTTVETPWFHGGNGRSLAVSSAVAASITWATGRAPVVAGKPSAVLAETLVRRLGLPPDQIAVVGDAPAEIALARHMGATAVSVLSGALSRADIDAVEDLDARPDHVFDDVADLYRHLGSRHLGATFTPPQGAVR